jgi:hypothetical protein
MRGDNFHYTENLLKISSTYQFFIICNMYIIGEIGIAPELQRLTFNDRVMEDSKLLKVYSVVNTSNINMEVVLQGGGCCMKWSLCCPCMICCPDWVNKRC